MFGAEILHLKYSVSLSVVVNFERNSVDRISVQNMICHYSFVLFVSISLNFCCYSCLLCHHELEYLDQLHFLKESIQHHCDPISKRYAVERFNWDRLFDEMYLSKEEVQQSVYNLVEMHKTKVFLSSMINKINQTEAMTPILTKNKEIFLKIISLTLWVPAFFFWENSNVFTLHFVNMILLSLSKNIPPCRRKW